MAKYLIGLKPENPLQSLFYEVENGEDVSLETIREIIGCDYVEHVGGYTKLMNDMRVAIYCDEEFKLKEGWMDKLTLGVFDPKTERMIELFAGTIVFALDGEDGDIKAMNRPYAELVLATLLGSKIDYKLSDDKETKSMRCMVYN